MKHIFKIILLTAILLWTITSLHAEESESVNMTLSPEIKSSLEQRLANFFDRVETYSVERQSEIYTNIQTKIPSALSRFETQSPEYQIINVVALFVSQRMIFDDDISNTQILRNIIFNESITTNDTSDDTPSSDNQSDTDNQDNENIVDENEVDPEYREDLDTDELNEVDKNILAGTAKGVMQLEVRANLEGVESETVEFRFNQNIENIGLVGRLYKNGFFVGESSQSDARGNVITIDNLSNFVIDTDTEYVQLELVTQAIGKEKIGKAMSNLQVTRTAFKDNTGVITGDKIGDRLHNQTSKNINIVPADLSVSVKSEFNSDSSTSHINIIPLVGNNNENGNVFSPRLSGITLLVSSLSNPGSVNVLNGNGIEIGSGNINGNGNTFISLSPDSISNSGEEYRIITSAEGNFRISQDGILYTAGSDTYTSKLVKQLFLGQK